MTRSSEALSSNSVIAFLLLYANYTFNLVTRLLIQPVTGGVSAVSIQVGSQRQHAAGQKKYQETIAYENLFLGIRSCLGRLFCSHRYCRRSRCCSLLGKHPRKVHECFPSFWLDSFVRVASRIAHIGPIIRPINRRRNCPINQIASLEFHSCFRRLNNCNISGK